MDLPCNAWVVVVSGDRRVVLENRGEKGALDLRIRPPHAVGAPQQDESAARRETLAPEDWRGHERCRFEVALARDLNVGAARDSFPAVALIADRHTLDAVRPLLGNVAIGRIVLELEAGAADLAVSEIEAGIAEA